MGDDTCAKMAPFFSAEIFEDVFLPIYKRMFKPAIDNGVPGIFHCCGKNNIFLDYFLEFGVEITEPAQEEIDLLQMKEKYKGKLSFAGSPIGAKGEEDAVARATEIIRNEAHVYGRKVYGYTD